MENIDEIGFSVRDSPSSATCGHTTKQWPLAFVCGSAGPKLGKRVRVLIALVLVAALVCSHAP